MAIKWTEDLATGVTVIDNQHKELFNRANALIDATSQSKGKEEITTLLNFLGEYVVSHFEMEELYMSKYNYPDFQLQKAQHMEFLKEFSDLKNRYEKEGVTSHFVIVVQNRVFSWLRNHICKVDKALGVFLKTRLP